MAPIDAEDQNPCYASSIFQWNCTIEGVYIQQFGSRFCASIAAAGIAFNILVILALRESMKRRRTKGQIHDVALAISDIFFGLVYVIFGVLNLVCDDFCGPCSHVKMCFYGFRFVLFLWLLFGAVNRSMTIYLSLVIAVPLANNLIAMNDVHKKTCKHVKDCSVRIAIMSFAIIFVFVPPAFFTSKLSNNEIPEFLVQTWVIIIFCAVVSLVEMTLAISIFSILVKFHLPNRSRIPIGKKTVQNYFKTIRVAFSALVFCSSHVFIIIESIFKLYAKDELETAQSSREYWSHIGLVSNSSVNVFIYLLTSPNFRVSLCRIMRIKPSGMRSKDVELTSIEPR